MLRPPCPGPSGAHHPTSNWRREGGKTSKPVLHIHVYVLNINGWMCILTAVQHVYIVQYYNVWDHSWCIHPGTSLLELVMEVRTCTCITRIKSTRIHQIDSPLSPVPRTCVWEWCPASPGAVLWGRPELAYVQRGQGLNTAHEEPQGPVHWKYNYDNSNQILIIISKKHICKQYVKITRIGRGKSTKKRKRGSL